MRRDPALPSGDNARQGQPVTGRRCDVHDLALSPSGACVLCARAAQSRAVTRIGVGLTVALGLAVGAGVGVKVLAAAMRRATAIDVPPARPHAPAPPPAAAPRPANPANAGNPANAPPTEAEIAAEQSSVSVVVYTTTWCPVCKRAKKWMAESGIVYTERDIEHDAAAMRDCRAINPRASIPTFDIEGATSAGFDADWVLQSIRAAAARHVAERRGS